MTRTLAHRGPDAEGFFVNGAVGLGHRRLSIVDLSQTGSQPMATQDGSCWITYNGEFYNHAVFRERLVQKGRRFRGTSDTETLLYLLEEQGPDCLAQVMAIFGLAFWEEKARRLTLARDHLGVKPLYYHDDGKRIVFASEIKALLFCPDVPREPDIEAINQYLHFHTALFERTLFKDVRQLRPGEYIQVTRHGARLRRYWSISDFSPRGGSAEANVVQLRHQLSHVVKEQLMSDVPVGSFFSGGIDSSAIAAYSVRNGTTPHCFGVHFSHQGVPDERPYQEAAAKALGLSLDLTTIDGSAFPDELMKLMYHQDEPVIGAAMFPMYHVSRLAAQRVKVCLGGQAGDEIFGGYARYALAHPMSVMRRWFQGRANIAGDGAPQTTVGGNLSRQFTERQTLRRISRNLRHLWNWESAYFENFAKVPEQTWKAFFDASEIVNRGQCRQMFQEVTWRSAATDPADKVMHWDLQTYLPGLFHQDDRMSMAVSLESRVPLADPRMVSFAFHTGFDLKFRGGASKWILRRAVSDVLPRWILNRRKVGFDTPAERWMKGQHAGFVRELLLSRPAKERGIWNSQAIERLLDDPDVPRWFDVAWKIVCLEAWAQVFLDGSSLCPRTADNPSYTYKQPEAGVLQPGMQPGQRITIRDLAQEVREDGIGRAVKRLIWEVNTRAGFGSTRTKALNKSVPPGDPRPFQRIFADPRAVADAMKDRIPTRSLSRLDFLASEATRGRILSFGKSLADYGNPIDWNRNPRNGHRWVANVHASKALAAEPRVGDIKLTWEVARFPQAFLLARGAAFKPDALADFGNSLLCQIADFISHNPAPLGVHWNSSQEIALRLLAWLFGIEAFARMGIRQPEIEHQLRSYVSQSVEQIGGNLKFTETFIYNNHLISEAVGLYLASSVLSTADPRHRLAHTGKQLLTQQAERQFYPDGGYIQQSHNYHRDVLQLFLTSAATARARKDDTPAEWLRAMERSLDFLLAHQNPTDGRLPNYGSNDGALPMLLSCCDFSDFRPTLQALSIATRGERIYEPGPWDEEACWLFGPQALDAPLRTRTLKSVSFPHTGYHVLRGNYKGSFGAFRSGTLLDRFSQIDMLHLDVWWRGHNVLVDAGSYLYNGPAQWHHHFMRTGSHNTVEIDGRDQMAHLRRFKVAYRTTAKLLKFEDTDEWVLCSGEHHGYKRHPGNCVHRRSLLFIKDDTWIVVDRIEGSGAHSVRLHWLGGDFPYRVGSPAPTALRLDTPDGPFYVSVFDSSGQPVSNEVITGCSDPPRGWLSRYYGEKVPVPSVSATITGQLPLTLVSILGAHVPAVTVRDSSWTLTIGDRTIGFNIAAGGIVQAGLLAPSLVVV